MKFLIWFLCIVVYSLLNTYIQSFITAPADATLNESLSNGAAAGLVSLFIFLITVVWPARGLCKRWDARKKAKQEADIPSVVPTETAEENIPPANIPEDTCPPKPKPKTIYTSLPRWRRPVAWLATFVVWMLMEYLIRLLITLCGSAIVYLESLSTVAVVVIVLIFGSLAVGILLMPLMYGPLLIAQLSESIYPSRSGSRFLVIAGLSLLGSLIGFILGFSSYMVFGSGVAKVTWFVSYGYCFICAVILFIFGARHEEAEIIKPISEDFSVTSEPLDPEYGTIAKKPIHVRGVDGEKQYLDALQTVSGQKLRYDRWGSLLVEGIDRPVDIYHLFLPSGEQYKTLYLYMYADKNDETVPDGFISTNQKKRTSKQEKPKTKIPEILAVVFGILLIGSVGVNAWQYIYYQVDTGNQAKKYNELVDRYNAMVTNHEAQIEDKSKAFDELQSKYNRLSVAYDQQSDACIELSGILENTPYNFIPLYNYSVLVFSGEKIYHKIDCTYVSYGFGSTVVFPNGEIKSGKPKSFYIYNTEAALSKGYKACSECADHKAAKQYVSLPGVGTVGYIGVIKVK
ncbi:MAG: hypothetical protein E7463_05595 [Ruminococcaceae bacterium]|nr:hypothetical protein [Oscillospiraceae bacterium]